MPIIFRIAPLRCDFYLEIVSSTNYEELLHEHDHEDSNIDNGFDPFVSTGSKDSAFDDDLSTSSYREQLISNASNEIAQKFNDILTLASEKISSLNTEKTFMTASREIFS